MEQKTLQSMKRFWDARYAQRGEGVVGHAHENHHEQTQKIIVELDQVIPKGSFYPLALDFGSGWGRMLPYLSEIAGHVYAVDLVASALTTAAEKIPNVTTYTIDTSYDLPVKNDTFDLLFSSLVLQHIVDEHLFQAATRELKRVLKPGATVILLDNAIDQAYHVKSRSAEALSSALDLQPGWTAKKVTINKRPEDHWLIKGVHRGG